MLNLRERNPERTVCAKAAGAWGYHKVTDDISDLTDAEFLDEISGSIVAADVQRINTDPRELCLVGPHNNVTACRGYSALACLGIHDNVRF